MSKTSPIVPLPDRTTSLLRSSIILPTYSSIASELVYNALDAHSTSIHLTVNLSTWTIQCRDNGSGITSRDLEGIDRYSTNKLSNQDQGYGFRGEALQSMQDLGMLHVVTREAESEETYELIKRNGETLHFARMRDNRNEAGTTVTVRDIFYKYPVRRKSLSTTSSQLGTISLIRSHLSIISLVHPGVSFYLTDASNPEPKNLLAVSRSPEGVLGRWKQLWGRAGIENVWEFERTTQEGIQMRLSGFISSSASHSRSNQHIFVNSQPLSPTTSTLYKSLNQLFSSSSFSRHSSSLLSFPSASPSHSRSPSPANARSQSRTTTTGRNTPKKAVEKHPIFFFHLELDPQSQIDKSFGMGEFDRKYIEFADEDRVLAFLGSVVKEFLVHKGFLSANTSLEQAPKGRKRADSDVQTRDVEDDGLQRGSGTLGTSERIEANVEGREQKKRKVAFAAPEPRPRQDPVVCPSSESHSTQEPSPSLVRPPLHWIDPFTNQTFDLDPRTGNSWRSDPLRDSNGKEKCTEEQVADCERCQIARVGEDKVGNRSGLVDRRALKRKSRASLGAAIGGNETETEAMPEWLRETLAEWENPIFPAAKPRSSTVRITSIAPPPQTSFPPPFGADRNTPFLFASSKPSLSNTKRISKPSAAKLTDSRLSTISNFFSSSSSTPFQSESTSLFSSSTAIPAPVTSQSFSRDSLRQAQFIAQVDDKYLLVKLPSSSPGQSSNVGEQAMTLVMFDQHAVSERIRVEKFLQEVCGRDRVERLELIETDVGGGSARNTQASGKGEFGVIVSREEARELDISKPDFERWGFKIRFDDCSPPQLTSQPDYVQVWIESVPKVVGQRLVGDPKLLQELVRGYLAQLRNTPPSHRREEVEKEGRHGENWLERIRDCPVGLIELINSKACRGAIMFNDRLRDDQAKELLVDLAETKFPFMCAHGRPSIVPVVKLPSPSLAHEEESVYAKRSRIDWNRFE